MEGFQPLSKTVRYVTADGTNEINRLLENGYQPYGDPLHHVDERTGDISTIQSMVKVESYDVQDYVNLFRNVMLFSERVMQVNAVDLFTPDELRDMGFEVNEQS